MTPFELAKQKRLEREAEEKVAKEAKESSYIDYENPEVMGLTDHPKVFRIVGLPVEIREKPTDPKLVYWSKIVTDTGKNWMHIYWPQKDGKIDEDWILWRLYQQVTESAFVKWKEGEIPDKRPRSTDKGYFVSKNLDKPSYIRIDKNKKEGSNAFGHFYPKSRVVMNVLDRHDNWCQTNKHTKLLSSSHNPFEFTDDSGKKSTIWFTDVGVPEQLYKLIWTQVIEFRNGWDFDLITYKEEKKYILRDGFEDKIDSKVKPLVSVAPLSVEEQAYGMYDLDNLYKPTGYYRLKNSLEKLFKQVDIDLGTKYHPELISLYEEEKKVREAEAKANQSTSVPVGDNPLATSEPMEPTRTRSPQETVSGNSILDKLKQLPGWDHLSPTDKKSMEVNVIDVVDPEKIDIRYKEGVGLIGCGCAKNKAYPDDVWTCPGCKDKVVFSG